MTAGEAKTAVEEIVHDTLNEVLFYQLINSAKDEREVLRDWYMLRAEDSSKTAAQGDTFETAKALPSRFLSAVGMNVGDVQNPYEEVAFQEKYKWKDSLNRFFIDIASDNFYLTGRVNENKTIHLFFTQGSADVDSSDDELAWKSRFHMLHVWDTALKHVGAIDTDDINALLTPGVARERLRLVRAMVQWDSDLQFKSMGGRRANRDDEDFEYPLGQM